MKTPGRLTTDAATKADARPLPGGGEVDGRSPETMPPEDRAMVLRGLKEARSGEFATEEEVRATLARFRI